MSTDIKSVLILRKLKSMSWWIIISMAAIIGILFNILQLHQDNANIIRNQETILRRLMQLELVIKVTHNESMLLHLDPKGFVKKFDIGSYRDKWNKDRYSNEEE